MPYYVYGGELFHYGVLGMRWGVRRYQNIDGSLTEAGKDHRTKYVAREQKRLTKQYARYEKKYQRKADKAAKKGDTKTRDYWLNRKKDAIASRDKVSKYIDNMDWDQIREDEARDMAGIKKAAKVGAIAGATVVGGGGLAALSAAGVLSAPVIEKKAVELANTPQVQAGKEWVDLGLKGYLGARSYVIATSVNTMMDNIDTTKIDRVGNSVGNALGNSIENATQSAGQGLVRGINSASSEINSSSDSLGKVLGSSGARILNSSAQSFMNGIDPSYAQAVTNGAKYVQNYDKYIGDAEKIGMGASSAAGKAAASMLNNAPKAAAQSFNQELDPAYVQRVMQANEAIRKKRGG